MKGMQNMINMKFRLVATWGGERADTVKEEPFGRFQRPTTFYFGTCRVDTWVFLLCLLLLIVPMGGHELFEHSLCITIGKRVLKGSSVVMKRDATFAPNT